MLITGWILRTFTCPTTSLRRLLSKPAKNINADIVVIGSVGRSGISGALIGNTAEKILDEVTADVLVVT